MLVNPNDRLPSASSQRCRKRRATGLLLHVLKAPPKAKSTPLSPPRPTECRRAPRRGRLVLFSRRDQLVALAAAMPCQRPMKSEFGGQRPDHLWAKLHDRLSPGWGLCRPDSRRRQTR
jgi:hypothetical protein